MKPTVDEQKQAAITVGRLMKAPEIALGGDRVATPPHLVVVVFHLTH